MLAIFTNVEFEGEHTHDNETCSFDMLEGLDFVSSFERDKISDEPESDPSLNPLFRLLAEWVERLILFHGGFQRFAIWMRFKLMKQLFHCFPAGVILLLDS